MSQLKGQTLQNESAKSQTLQVLQISLLFKWGIFTHLSNSDWQKQDTFIVHPFENKNPAVLIVVLQCFVWNYIRAFWHIGGIHINTSLGFGNISICPQENRSPSLISIWFDQHFSVTIIRPKFGISLNQGLEWQNWHDKIEPEKTESNYLIDITHFIHQWVRLRLLRLKVSP